MKSRNFLAIVLSVSLLTTSLSGVFISYAKSETIKNNSINKAEVGKVGNNGFETQEFDVSDGSGLNNLPSQNVMYIQTNILNPEKLPSNKITTDAEDEGKILYQVTESALNPDQEDMFTIEENEIKEFLNQGYTVEDIFEADKLSNELCIEPEALLAEKAISKKSFKEIKTEKLKKSKEIAVEKLKTKYKVEYEKLKEKKLSETKIINFLSYADIKGIKVSDELINEYQKKGDQIFRYDFEVDPKGLSANTKQKYHLSDAVCEDLSEELITNFEKLSKETGRTVEELIEGYNQCIQSAVKKK